MDMRTTKETLEELFRWHKIYLDASKGFPKMQDLDRECHMVAFMNYSQRVKALIKKASNVV